MKLRKHLSKLILKLAATDYDIKADTETSTGVSVLGLRHKWSRK